MAINVKEYDRGTRVARPLHLIENFTRGHVSQDRIAPALLRHASCRRHSKRHPPENTPENKIPRSNITQQMVKKIFHHSRKETRPNTVLEPVKPTTDPHFEESNQSSTIDPRTANVESQLESRLSEERAKAKIADQEAGEKTVLFEPPIPGS
ncbi:unnamed protein product [Brassica napus]|uniref:(rape) hypothetical protein n=1 Tax=Brassica napus TaxID=3708 RepID=A0A816PMG5_BRANA|nr:unnamed protein product [Brassica napus]